MALVVNNITKDFRDVRAVDQLSIEIREGRIFGFLGPNGAGKKTKIRMILDLIQPDSGYLARQTSPPASPGYLRLPSRRTGLVSQNAG